MTSRVALPLLFEPNVGQADQSARFLAHSSGGVLFFSPSEVALLRAADEVATDRPRFVDSLVPSGVVATRPDLVRMYFLGASPLARIEQGDETTGRVNYLIGYDPSGWRTDLPTYSHITYKDLYPGVDLRYEGNGADLKGTYTIFPGADPQVVRWSYTDAANLSLNEAGDLLVTIKSEAQDSQSEIIERAPVAWQEIGGERRMIAARYALHSDKSVEFSVGSYDPAYPLTIDPVVVYSNLFGGSNNDFGQDVAVDAAGNSYVVGWTTSSNFPLVNPFQSTLMGINDVFVSKWSADGSTLLYSTYLGGSSQERGFGIAVDGAGNAYVTGRTDSDDFPTRNAFQPESPGAFVAKLNANGSDLVYSTYLGGEPAEGGNGNIGNAIAVDGAGSAYVTGETSASDFPTLNAIQPAYGGGESDVFVTKFNPAGDQLVYSTFLGGSGTHLNAEAGFGIDVDAAGNTYVTGFTTAGDFPTANPIQPSYGGGEGDGFVAKLNPAGSALIYSTYLGGDDNFGDGAADIVADSAGNVYITGMASSANFPTSNALQGTLRGISDVFITKLNPTGSQFIYSTFLGGNNIGSLDGGTGIVIDDATNVYISAQAGSPDFPTVNPIPPGPGGNSGIIVAKLHFSGSSLIYSSFVPAASGYTQYESGHIAIDGQGDVYLTGRAFGPSSVDAFAIKISEGTPGTATATAHASATSLPSTATSTMLPSTATATTSLSSTATAISTATPTTTSSPTNMAVAPSSTPTSCAVTFTDVPEGSTFYDNIRCLACRGIVNGYSDGTFRPGDPVTRGQLSKIVSNSAGYVEDHTNQSFEDVAVGSTFHLFIERLFSRGFISGYACGGAGEPCVPPANRPYFRSNANVTRGQTSKIVASARGLPAPIPGQQTFEDVAEGSTFWEWIEALATNGAISGYACGNPELCVPPGNRPYFRPNNPVTRGQSAKIVASAFFPMCILRMPNK